MPVVFPRDLAGDDYLYRQACQEALDRLRRLAEERTGIAVLDPSAVLPAHATAYQIIATRGD